MLLRIQKNESLRSYVERNLFIPNNGPTVEVFKKLHYCHWDANEVKSIANLLGLYGCYGFNKLIHTHSEFPWYKVLKSKFDLSYSGFDYVSREFNFDSLTSKRVYCPVCAMEDKRKLGYSYWRRIHHKVTVCAKHNVVLLAICPYCDKPFARGGHPVSVMWSGCAGRHLDEAKPLPNVDAVALRLAKFFDELCSAEHHIYLETAFEVLETKLTANIENSNADQLNNELVEAFQGYIRHRKKYGSFRSRGYDRDFRHLVEFASEIYDTFADFVADCHELEPNPPAINAFWDTFCFPTHFAEHFITEDYRTGVASWSWPHLEECNLDPLHTESARMNRKPRYYRCCNSADSHLIGFLPTQYRHALFPPAVPRLTDAELLAMTEWPISA